MCSFEAAQQDAANAASCPRRGFSVSSASPTSSPACETSSRPSSSSRAGLLRRSPLCGLLFAADFLAAFLFGEDFLAVFFFAAFFLFFAAAFFFFLGAAFLLRSGLGRRSRRLRSGRRRRLRSGQELAASGPAGPQAFGAGQEPPAAGASGPRRRRRSRGLERGRRGLRRDRDARGPEHLLGVVLGVDLVEDVADSSVLAHEERLAQRTDSPRGIRVLAPCAIRLVHGMIGIRQELERQVVLGGERIVRRGVVARDSEDLDPGALQLAPGVAQAARFARASGSVVFRIEIDQNVLAAPIVMQRDRLARASRKREIGSGRTGTQGRGSLHFIGHLAVLRRRRISK